MKIKLTHYSLQTKEIYEFHKLNKFVNTEQRFFREGIDSKIFQGGN